MAKKRASDALFMLMDKSVPWEHRKRFLMHLCMDEASEGDETIQALCDAAANGNAESLFTKKLKDLEELMGELNKGLLRSAVFVRLLDKAASTCRAQIVLENGDTAYVVVPNADLAKALRCGEVVLLEAQGRAVIGRDPVSITVGEQGRLERRIDKDLIEVTLRDHETHIYRSSADLAARLDADQVKPGSKLLVCPRRLMAFGAVPTPDGLSHYWYLVRDPVPDVRLDRDVGNPPVFIDELLDHIRAELETPETNRRYRIRRAHTKLLTGVSGSGKTLSIQAVWRSMYELMSEVTGVAVEKLPPRVLRLRMPSVLSKWLGESDKRLDRFFDEAEQLADEKFVAPGGREWELPVLVVGEEIEGLARTRGDGEPVYDRIQTTALERLDVNCQRLRNRLILFLFTTNVPHLVDSAFLRRAGGTIERFGRIDRRAFPAILSKHVRALPFHAEYGAQERAERRAVREVTDWLFSPNGHDSGEVALTYVGSSSPVLKYRRDFLTGALVDRAVQEAAAEACRAERFGCDAPGLTTEHLILAFDDQIRSIVDQLSRDNVSNYLTLPDGVRVGDVRRIEQPSIRPVELESRIGLT